MDLGNEQQNLTSNQPAQDSREKDLFKHKNYFFSILVITSAILLLIVIILFLSNQKQSINTSYRPKIATTHKTAISVTPTADMPAPTYTPVPGNFDVVVKQNSSCKSKDVNWFCKGDIYLTDSKSGQEIFYLTTDNVHVDSRVPKFINGNLFVIKRIGDTSQHFENGRYVDNPWTDELWLYDSQGNVRMLYSEKGLHYLSNEDASLVAVDKFNISEDKNKIDNMARIIPIKISEKELDIKINIDSCVTDPKLRRDMGWRCMNLQTWETKNTLWGDFCGMHDIKGCFWKVNVESGAISYYPVISGINRLEVLNTEKLMAVYSDRPVFLDESYQYYAASNTTYSIYLYNLQTKQSTLIDTFPSSFNPSFSGFSGKWVSPTQLVYSSPSGDKTYTLPANTNQ